jgi:hypothetical protein
MVFFKRAKTKPEEAKADRERIKKGRKNKGIHHEEKRTKNKRERV